MPTYSDVIVESKIYHINTYKTVYTDIYLLAGKIIFIYAMNTNN